MYDDIHYRPRWGLLLVDRLWVVVGEIYLFLYFYDTNLTSDKFVEVTVFYYGLYHMLNWIDCRK